MDFFPFLDLVPSVPFLVLSWDALTRVRGWFFLGYGAKIHWLHDFRQIDLTCISALWFVKRGFLPSLPLASDGCENKSGKSSIRENASKLRREFRCPQTTLMPDSLLEGLSEPTKSCSTCTCDS